MSIVKGCRVEPGSICHVKIKCYEGIVVRTVSPCIHTITECKKYHQGCLSLGSEEDVVSIQEEYVSGVYTPEFQAQLVDNEKKDECACRLAVTLCIAIGCNDNPPLPREKVAELKAKMLSLLPRFLLSPVDFQPIWTKCV